jgi:hypothetical protein
MNQRIVVAKYKEDIGWLNDLRTKGYEIIVYNKDTELKHYKDYQKVNPYWVDLCNIGREAHTYLTHIIQNYDSLREVEIFLQGKVEDHIQPASIQDVLRDCEKEFYRGFGNINKIGCFNEKVYEMVKKMAPDHPHIEPAFPPHGIREYMFFKEVFPQLPFPKEPYVFRPFALFSVRKEMILAYPKSFYEMLREYFNPAADNFLGVSPKEFIDDIGYTFEFFWQFIFTLPLQNYLIASEPKKKSSQGILVL